ncbi:MAG: hypothetical protein QNM02_14170 [Acidimicrobiia bacterium]|nr:hypothetical protein [Acidimicrobiia bacterium]
MTLGPVQVIAVEFDSIDQMRGQVLGAIDELTPLGAARIIDALFVAKDEFGDLVALESGDVGDEDEELGELVGMLLGFSFDGDDGLDSTVVEAGDPSLLGVSPADIERIGDDLAPGTGALLLLVEHRWATGLREAVTDAGGRMIAQGFLTPDGVMLLGAELVATADAIDAIETAIELEAIATVRSLEALATIAVAAEVEAAVVARTILTLVEAGMIEAAAAEQAAAAVIDAALIEQALTSGADPA